MRVFAVAALCLCALTTQAAENFGDEVARCLSAKKVMPDTPEFDAAVPVCETTVENSRKRRAAMDALRDAWGLCLRQQAATIDDGISPASDIGTALQQSCEADFAAMTEAMMLPPEVKYQAYRERAASTKDVVTRLVLLNRAAKNREKPLKQ